MYDLPTRSEVDEIHHSIYDMRKEVKSLKKALAEPQLKG
ncbi:poly(R)-hydroxyalkanoic acid synthase subunit PhaE [Microcoleus asticus]|uniref:Poly(3-hydroxyalkanoate) polymerase subunit PhaE n=1 Tax=Microcoleus asticus IPMA8 TaxID=2563858 RepID=A0ABX2D288_9CYAN|nr:poly(R)-hydroxyalkanoic acid synthase subunit PhaE [Microcoleus asticus]NQE36762.1 Poly(3-hydroxyalkanoate) polymerase subunit PhaE [Microcoleus asticus IPMA8]